MHATILSIGILLTFQSTASSLSPNSVLTELSGSAQGAEISVEQEEIFCPRKGDDAGHVVRDLARRPLTRLCNRDFGLFKAAIRL